MSDYIHIYSNSWGPADNGFTVERPGRLLAQTFVNGAAHVCKRVISIIMYTSTYFLFTLYLCLYRVGMEQALFMCGQREMVGTKETPVLLMPMLPASTLLQWALPMGVGARHTMMKTALLR